MTRRESEVRMSVFGAGMMRRVCMDALEADGR